MKIKTDRFGAVLFALASCAVLGECDDDLRQVLAPHDDERRGGEQGAAPVAPSAPGTPAPAEQADPVAVPDDGRGGLRRANASIQVRAVRKDAREADFVASTESVDSHGTIIKQDWDFSRFEKNPVILWLHNRDWAVPNLPVGKAVKWKVKDGALVITVRFATAKANPFAELVWQSVLEDMLRAGSVGFYPGRIAQEKHGEAWIDVLSECELLEFSVCPIGSNPDALVQLGERVMRALAGTEERAVDGGPAARAPQPVDANRGPVSGPKKGNSRMRTIKLSRAHLLEVVAKGFSTVKDGEGDGAEVVLIESPEGREMLGQVEVEKARADAAVLELATVKGAVEKDKADLTKKIVETEARATVAEARASAAITARVKLELDPLVESGDMEIGERDTLAGLAGAGKDTEYDQLRAAAVKRAGTGVGTGERTEGSGSSNGLRERSPVVGTPPRKRAGDTDPENGSLTAGSAMARLIA